MNVTKEQAQILVEAHEVRELLDNDEERELLEANNFGLMEAYLALVKLADA